MDVDVVIAGLLILPDFGQVHRWVGAAYGDAGDVFLPNPRNGLLEVRRQLQLLVELTAESRRRPELERRLPGRPLVGVPADHHLAESRLAASSGGLEGLDRLRIRCGSHESVADLARDACRLLPTGRHHDGRRLRRPGVDASVFDDVVLTAMAYRLAAPEEADDLDGFLEHLEPNIHLGPMVAEDVLVQVLPRADAQKEASGHHHGGRPRRLRDDGRMRPDQPTRRTPAHPGPAGRLRGGPD